MADGFVDDPGDESRPDLSALEKIIDAALAAHRPDRIIERHIESRDADLITYEEFYNLVTTAVVGDENAQFAMPSNPGVLLVRELVEKRERHATVAPKTVLRIAGETGQLPLFMHDMDDLPVAVETRIQKPGQKPVIKKEHIALRAMTTPDWEAFSNIGRERQAKKNRAESFTYDGGDVARFIQVEQRKRFFKGVVIEDPPEDEE